MLGEMKYADAETLALIGKINEICTSLESAKDSLNAVDEAASALEGVSLSTSTVIGNIDSYLQELNTVINDINRFTTDYLTGENSNIKIMNKLLLGEITGLTKRFTSALLTLKDKLADIDKLDLGQDILRGETDKVDLEQDTSRGGIGLVKSIIEKFSKKIEYTTRDVKFGQDGIGKYFVSIPQNATTKPENVIVFFHGASSDMDQHLMIDAIKEGASQGYENPNAIIIEPKMIGAGTANLTFGGPYMARGVRKIIDDTLEEQGLEREDVKITVIGYSSGGGGALFFAANKNGIIDVPDSETASYADNVIVLDGGSGNTLQDVEQPMIGYGGKQTDESGGVYMDENFKYMVGPFSAKVGEENVIEVESSHPSMTLNSYLECRGDKDDKKRSYMMEWALSNGEIGLYKPKGE